MALAGEMAEADHPIVRYAAGWAMGDVALQPKVRTRKGLPPYELRLACLNSADTLWDESIPLLEAAHDAASHEPFKAEYYAYANRARWARACLPLMQIEAAWRSDHWLPYKMVAASVLKMRTNALELGAELLGRNWDNEHYRRKLLCVVREITAAVALQDDPLLRYIVRPASMRQDHHYDMRRRADLIATAISSGHSITPIQVDSAVLGSDGRPRRPVQARPNVYVLPIRSALVTDAEPSAPMLLKAFIAREYGPAPDAALVARLGELSFSLANGLSDFRRAYDPSAKFC
jgi:hypothetical protein